MTRVLLAAAVLVALACAPPAAAGTYDVWSCATPAGASLPVNGWRAVANGAPLPSNECAERRGLRAALPPLAAAAGSSAGWWFEAPAGMTIGSYELYRSARPGAVTASQGQRAFGLYHDEPRFEPTVFLFEYCVRSPQGCALVGDPDSPNRLDPDNVVSRRGLRIKRLILRLECFGGGDCAAADPPGDLTIGSARIGLNDDSAPTLGALGGSVFAPDAVLDGSQAVHVAATDVGGGIHRIEVVADGQVVATDEMAGRRPSCRMPYVELVPCPTAVDVDFAFDTARVPNGSHAIQVAAVDVAGNRTLSPAVHVRIANGATPNGAGATRAARLTAAFVSKRRRNHRQVRVAFGGSRRVRGRLVDVHGRPISGARVDVMATQRMPAARPVQEGVARTDAHGRFRYTPRRGPSRRLQFAYRAFSLDPVPAATATVALEVSAGVHLVVRPRRTTSRGAITFRGRLLGGPGRDGVQVTLYAVGRRQRSRVPVSVLSADPSGRFQFRYRFVRTFAPFTYRFVARVERQRGYPYAAGSSPVATVRVVR